MATAPAPNSFSITGLIREIWSQHEGDMPGASNELYRRITSDQDALNEILPGVLLTWCREQVGGFVGSIRLASIQAAPDADQSSRIRRVIAVTLFDFPLPGGKRLGDANAGEIRDGAAAYGRTAQDALHKARFLNRVAEKVGRKNKAENALTLAQLEQIFEESRNEA